MASDEMATAPDALPAAAPLRPPRLKPGDRVALLAPAGPVTRDRLSAALDRCRALGLEPVPGAAVEAHDGYLAGSDAGRAADLQNALDDDDIAAVWPVRGGYGTMRILPLVDLGDVARRPKAFIGFSDNTAVHLALRRAGLVSFHGPHAGYPVLSAWSETLLRRLLFEPGPAGTLPEAPGAEPPRALAGGVATGELVGGNLALLAALCGTPYQPATAGRILFLEDVGEPVYRVDRMLTQLSLAGVGGRLAGVALGRFTDMVHRRDERPLQTVLREWAEPLGVPVLAGLPFGHVADSWTLPLGVRARLDADAGSLTLLEPATR